MESNIRVENVFLFTFKQQAFQINAQLLQEASPKSFNDSVMDALENNVPRIDGRINVWCQHIPITEVTTATVVAWQTLPKGCHECIHPANLRAGVCC